MAGLIIDALCSDLTSPNWVPAFRAANALDPPRPLSIRRHGLHGVTVGLQGVDMGGLTRSGPTKTKTSFCSIVE